jgi:ABC-2 type transport system permease protein
MKTLKLIIKREFNAKVRNKSFIIMTILSPFLVVGMGFLIFYLTKANDSKVKTIAYVDNAKLIDKNTFKDSEMVKYLDLTAIGIDSAKAQAEKKEYYGLLTIPKQDSLELLSKSIYFYSKKSPNRMMIESLEKKIENNLRHSKLERLGIDSEKIKLARISSTINLTNYSGEKSSKFANNIKMAVGSIGGYLLMMFIMIYGTSVMRSVIEEKTSRIIEIIISSVKPFQLMMGKIIGNALAGLTQFAIWGIMIAVLGIAALSMSGIDLSEMQQANVSAEQLEIAKEVTKTGAEGLYQVITEMPMLLLSIMFIVYFLGGYLLYSALYAAIGAAVDSETDTQQFMMPIMIPLMLGVYVGAFSVVNDPHGPVATIFSMIPLTSPIVMLMRIPFDVPGWQIAVSVALLVASFIFTVWFAAKIYRVGILMYGKKPTFKDLYKWMRYKS